MIIGQSLDNRYSQDACYKRTSLRKWSSTPWALGGGCADGYLGANP